MKIERGEADAMRREATTTKRGGAKRWLGLGAMAFAAASLVGLSAACGSESPDASKISALTEAPMTDRSIALGERFAESGQAGLEPDPGSFRQTLEEPRNDVFISQAGTGEICVTLVKKDAKGAGAEPGSSCLPANTISDLPLIVESVAPDGARRAGIVPDGYTEVFYASQTVPVVQNTFLVERLPKISERGPLEVTGEGVRTIRALD